MTVRRHLTERLRDPGSDRVFCAPPSPPRRVLGGGDDDNADWVARGLSSSENGSIVASTLRWSSASLLPSGGDRGGGEKAHGSPGRGEEDKYRGWKVQGGVDEAQRRREEEEGESVGGRDRDGVPGMGSRGRGPGDEGRARVRRATATPGDQTTTQRMPLRRVSERWVSPPAPRRSLRTRGRRWLIWWGLEVEE